MFKCKLLYMKRIVTLKPYFALVENNKKKKSGAVRLFNWLSLTLHKLELNGTSPGKLDGLS